MNGNASSSSNANSRRITMSPTMQEQSPSRRIDFDAIPENARQAATTTTTTTTTRQKKSRQSLKQQHLQQQQYRNRHSSSPLPVSPSPSKNTVGPLSMPQSPSPSHGATPTKNDVQQHRASNPNNATNSVSTPHSSSTTSSSAKKSFLFRSTKQRSSSPAVAASQSTQQQQQQQDKRRRSSSKPKRRSKSKGRLANNSVSESSVSRSEEASTAHDAESIASSTMSMSATLVPTKDGTFVSSATMKRRQRLAASSNSLKNHNNNNSNSNSNKASSKKKTFSIGASKAVSSSLQAARGMMAFRKAKSTKAVGGKGNHADDDDDDDVATDLLCRTVRVAPADSDPTAMQHPENPIAKQNMTPAQLRAQRRETERIARAAAALDNKGNQLFEKGYYDKAMEIYTKALRLKRRTFHTLLDEADDILDEALEGENLARNPEKADAKLLVSMATSINNIGYLRQRSGEATHDETMAAYRKSLRIKREILGMDSLSVGKTLNNIGSVHYLKREFPDALVAYTEALRIMQSNLGDFDKDVATVWSNMGDVYWAMGKQKEQSLEHYRTALTIRWERFGEHDPRVVRLLEKIAAIEIGDKMLAQSELQNATNANARHMIDEDDLFDLDNRPVVQELHMLHNEVEKDMMYVDLMQKRMKVDMVKDKVNIMRGMRLLEETSKQQMDAMTKTTIPPKSPTTAPTNRETALQNIKNRLAKLRENRETQTEQQTENHKKYSTLCGTSLYKATTTTIQRPTLSSYEPNELKQELDSIRSAFVLKQGIESLRSFAV